MIIGFRGFRLKTISYGDSPGVVVICELYANGNSFTSAEQSVYLVSFPLILHLRYSCRELFNPSTKPLAHGARDVRGSCSIL